MTEGQFEVRKQRAERDIFAITKAQVGGYTRCRRIPAVKIKLGRFRHPLLPIREDQCRDNQTKGNDSFPSNDFFKNHRGDEEARGDRCNLPHQEQLAELCHAECERHRKGYAPVQKKPDDQ